MKIVCLVCRMEMVGIWMEVSVCKLVLTELGQTPQTTPVQIAQLDVANAPEMMRPIALAVSTATTTTAPSVSSATIPAQPVAILVALAVRFVVVGIIIIVLLLVVLV